MLTGGWRLGLAPWDVLHSGLTHWFPVDIGQALGSSLDLPKLLNTCVDKLFEVFPQGDRCMHEFVASARQLRRERKISAMDIAKRLLDYGYHAPTVYFPLIVKEAMMIEPTETESKETLDQFVEALLRIAEEAKANPELVRRAPQRMPVDRLDEVKAAPGRLRIALGFQRFGDHVIGRQAIGQAQAACVVHVGGAGALTNLGAHLVEQAAHLGRVGHAGGV